MGAPPLIIVRGGGDIATGTIHRLHRCGFRLLVLESDSPTAIRRTVCFSEAIFSSETEVEGVSAAHISSPDQCETLWRENKVPVLIDRNADSVKALQPSAVIDAIIAKKNCGTTINMAPITIALGPGFTAGEDVHAVIETARGHNLGRVIYSGKAMTNSGIPGTIQGYNRERVLYAPSAGILKIERDIGARVIAGDTIATINATAIKAPISGIVRGMLRHGSTVHEGLKIADIDPRSEEVNNYSTISDKARCISGGVLEALFHLTHRATP